MITFSHLEKVKPFSWPGIKTIPDYCWVFLIGFIFFRFGFKFSYFQNRLRKRVNLETTGMNRSRYVIWFCKVLWLLPECNLTPGRPEWPMVGSGEQCERTGLSGLGEWAIAACPPSPGAVLGCQRRGQAQRIQPVSLIILTLWVWGFLFFFFLFNVVEAKVSLFRFLRHASVPQMSSEYRKHQFGFHSHGNTTMFWKTI